MPSTDTCSHIRRAYTIFASGGFFLAPPADATSQSADLADLWSRLQIVEAEGQSFVYRFVGAAIQAELAFDVTGARVGSRLYPVSFAADMLQGFSWVRDNARPLFVISRYLPREGAFQHVARLLLPLEGTAPSSRMLVARAVRAALKRDRRETLMRPQEGAVLSNTVIASIADLDRVLNHWIERDEPVPGPSPVSRLSGP